MRRLMTAEAIDLANRYESGEFEKGGPGSGVRGHTTPKGMPDSVHQHLLSQGFTHKDTGTGPSKEFHRYQRDNGDGTKDHANITTQNGRVGRHSVATYDSKENVLDYNSGKGAGSLKGLTLR